MYKSCCCSSPLQPPLKCVESFIKQSQTATSQYYRGKTEDKTVPQSQLPSSLLALYSSNFFSAFASPFVRNAGALGGFRAAEIQNIKRLQLSVQSLHSSEYSTVLNLYWHVRDKPASTRLENHWAQYTVRCGGESLSSFLLVLAALQDFNHLWWRLLPVRETRRRHSPVNLCQYQNNCTAFWYLNPSR